MAPDSGILWAFASFALLGKKTLGGKIISLDEAGKLRLEAMHLQEIAGNPLDADDIAMFEMFDREGWSHDRRLAYIRERVAAFRALS